MDIIARSHEMMKKKTEATIKKSNPELRECANCMTTEAKIKLLECARCGLVAYCNKNCQVELKFNFMNTILPRMTKITLVAYLSTFSYYTNWPRGLIGSKAHTVASACPKSSASCHRLGSDQDVRNLLTARSTLSENALAMHHSSQQVHTTSTQTIIPVVTCHRHRHRPIVAVVTALGQRA